MSGYKQLPATPLDLPLLPLRDVVVFPHMVIPLFVGRPKSIKALELAMESDRRIMLVAQKAAAKDEPAVGDMFDMGAVSTILQMLKLPDGTVYHLGQVTEGFLKQGDTVKIELDQERRSASARNHSATHLLQAALREVLGTHVNQAGSYVGPDRLRFDFSHFSAMTPAEISAVELAVNRAILTDTNIGTIETSQDMAKQMGAMALFGEKYGEKVRVVVVGDISKELCGGTHVGSTGEIGQFKIIAESSVGSGLRRIEAVTGLAALDYVNQREAMLEQAAQLLKTRPEELVSRIEISLNRARELEKK